MAKAPPRCPKTCLEERDRRANAAQQRDLVCIDLTEDKVTPEENGKEEEDVMTMSEVQKEERKAELVTILECASKYKLAAGGGRLWPSRLPLGKAPYLAKVPPRSGIAKLMQHSEEWGDFGQVVWPWESHPTWPKSPSRPKTCFQERNCRAKAAQQKDMERLKTNIKRRDFGQFIWPWDRQPTWPKSPQTPSSKAMTKC